MLITEKVGPVWLVTQQGAKMPVMNVPKPSSSGRQGGMLGVYLSPNATRPTYNVYTSPIQSLASPVGRVWRWLGPSFRSAIPQRASTDSR